MSFKKTAQAEVVNIISPDDWQKMHGDKVFRGCKIDGDHPFCKTASIKKKATTKFLLTHSTIMTSVMTEPLPHDWLIKPEASIFVNGNDDTWANPVLKLCYKTFIGAYNFVEHLQAEREAKGIVCDSILRTVHLSPDIWVYFVDILVATDLKHEALVADIRSGKVKYMSMGCITELVVCSFCGARVTDNSKFCYHLEYLKGTFLEDEDGVPRHIAELCGHESLPGGGVKLIESSWVAHPAAPSAIVRNVVADEWEGPTPPYKKSAKSAGFSKAASKLNPAELLLDEDYYGGFRR
jgi:hypothetical protein